VALPANYFVLRTSPVPSAMVEVGFLTNAKEKGLLKDPAYQRKVATAVALGLADFLRSQVPQTEAGVTIGQ
jgi:N-acetylmuramoyl-L-alanine amidase